MAGTPQPISFDVMTAGMELCSNDFKKWADITGIHRQDEGTSYVLGTVDRTGVEVFVPEGELLEIRGRCVRMHRPLAELDSAGFDQRPSEIA